MRSASSGIQVALQTPQGERFQLPCSAEMQRAAYRWTYVLRNSLRWRGDASTKKELPKTCRRQLVELGLTARQLSRLADRRIIEVSIPYRREDEGWEARILPWEFLLSEATKTAGRREHLTVVRHLQRRGSLPRLPIHLTRLLVVSGAPGGAGGRMDISQEKQLPASNLFADPDATSDRIRTLEDPTLEELVRTIADYQPQVIHLAGVDLHRGLDPFDLAPGQQHIDGIVLRQEREGSRQPALIPAEQLAASLTAARRKAALLVFHLYQSAARTAPLAVAHGAGAAIGFQDAFRDAVAEAFLADFYEALRRTAQGSQPGTSAPADVHQAFIAALRLLRRYPSELRGSGIVLWSARSLLDEPPEQAAASYSLARGVSEQIRERDAVDLIAADAVQARKLVSVDVAAKQQLNYSLLHNRQALFERFQLRKQRGRVEGVQVEVQLHVGNETPGYRATLAMDGPAQNLEDTIFVPLTWMKEGGFWENVRSSLQVRVTWQDFELYADSHPVTLLPADQWTDSDENRQSLPSFVYPRDPAVGRIIQAAQEVLIGLTDDLTAGFDGYQSIDPDADDPTAGVDLQVQAVWTTLIHKIPLAYINPPPSFADFSQRLRTPSEVLDGGRGTCIDLTLLLAACLEYVEIYPVIFLLEGHAFPGYWRSDRAHDDFLVPLEVVTTEQSPSVWQRAAWLLEGKSAYHEVARQVHDENLVPLESVWLTQRAGFWEAVEEGWENLRIASEFHSLIDVTMARQYDVTPLPIRGLRN